jgi:hypothetical protein
MPRRRKTDANTADPAVEANRRRAAAARALKRLFQGKSPQEWRAEYAGAYDWGPDIGREAIQD